VICRQVASTGGRVAVGEGGADVGAGEGVGFRLGGGVTAGVGIGVGVGSAVGDAMAGDGEADGAAVGTGSLLVVGRGVPLGPLASPQPASTADTTSTTRNERVRAFMPSLSGDAHSGLLPEV
jgi:hypothetical protein